jgi:hypothetical protein
MRNLDILGLIALAPGLLMVAQGKGLGVAGVTQDPRLAQIGYLWLFGVGLFFLVRLLADPMMVRRPLLEPNLSTGGMAFLCGALMLFMVANVIVTEVSDHDLDGPRRLDDWLRRSGSPPTEASLAGHGPGYMLMHLLPAVPSKLWQRMDETLPTDQAREMGRIVTAKTMAIIAHLAVVVGLVVIGFRHFDNIRTGIAVATLYLLLPYTAQTTGRVDHVLPAALLVWAVEAYRRPLISGMLLGLAVGVIYFPIFLLPLWLAFYWQRGLLRFAVGVGSMIALLVLTLYFTSIDLDSFVSQVKFMFGWPGTFWSQVDGFWDLDKSAYRITVLAAFLAMCGGLALWPAQKNLGTLLSCSAAVMLGTQFWQGQGGGLHVAWYLPLLVLTVFRPNLEDRLAISALDQSWFEKRRAQLRRIEKAA